VKISAQTFIDVKMKRKL